VELSEQVEALQSENKDLKDTLVLKIREAVCLKKSGADVQERNLELERRCMYTIILSLFHSEEHSL
jgi:hypothetical protein